MANAVLVERYEKALGGSPGGMAALAALLAEEDEYASLTAGLLHKKATPEPVVASYGTPEAFAGGGECAERVLTRAMRDVAALARRVAPSAPTALAVWWPERTLSAGGTLGDGGVLIRVNLGLLGQLRFFSHLAASCLAAITEDRETWGEDGMTAEQAREEFLAMLDVCVGGDPLPMWQTVRIHSGPREEFRRAICAAGLAYVVAHELGHFLPENREYSLTATRILVARRVGDPARPLENQQISAFAAEMGADWVACRILLEAERVVAPPAGREMQRMVLAVGAGAVMAIEATRFWLQAAKDDTSLGWTHPDPEFRLAALQLVLENPEELARLKRTNSGSGIAEAPKSTKPFTAWVMAATGLPVFRNAALARGLEGRGLSPMQLAFVHLTQGA